MAETPFYRYDIGGGKYLPFHVINFSRGCPFKCEFCSIQSTLGNFRTRPVDSVVAEIERTGSRNIWFRSIQRSVYDRYRIRIGAKHVSFSVY